MNTNLATGTLSINATQQGTLPLNVSGLVPGDSITRPINLVNDGNLAFGGINLATTVGTPSVLTSDAVNGLQKSVRSCALAWTQTANTYSCASGEKPLGSGPVMNDVALTGSAALATNGTDYLAYTISLPTTAGNTFQGQTAALSLVFSGSQLTGTTR